MHTWKDIPTGEAGLHPAGSRDGGGAVGTIPDLLTLTSLTDKEWNAFQLWDAESTNICYPVCERAMVPRKLPALQWLLTGYGSESGSLGLGGWR